MITSEMDVWKGVQIKKSELINIGNILNYKFFDNELEIYTEKYKISIIFYTEEIIKVSLGDYEQKPLNTLAVVGESKKLNFKLKDGEDKIILNKSDINILINKNPFSLAISKGNVNIELSKVLYDKYSEITTIYIKREDDQYIYGLGEKNGYLNKNNEETSMWNTDVPEVHSPDIKEMYQSHPYYIAFKPNKTYGVFLDNPARTYFDFSKENHHIIKSEKNGMDLYFYVGPTIKKVVEQHTFLTGKNYFPPKWSLGYHQSRWGYNTDEEMIELLEKFKEKDIPIDVLHFDISYMDGYRVFTFDRNRFKDPKSLIKKIKDEYQVNVVPIVDPGVKQDGNFSIFKEGVSGNHFCKYDDGRLYIGKVWPGDSVFPDFTRDDTRNWWGEKHKYYTDLGILGIWNDMNEPAIMDSDTKTMPLDVMFDCNGENRRHDEVHNLYGFFMGKATYDGLNKLLPNKRHFILTRAGYPGVQRYAAVWTGDNRSFWEHLQLFLPMCMNLGLSGVAFCGPDVGGFANECNGELLTRWMQAGVFTPFFRNHNVSKQDQEPWAFGEFYESIIKKYLKMRYEWMPYIYQCFKNCHETGLPIMRPLVLEYEDDNKTYNLYDQFLFGENVLVAPILFPSKDSRIVYLPKGKWYDYWTGKLYSGNQEIIVDAPIDKLPLFIKSGSIIPTTTSSKSTRKVNDIIFNIYVDESHNKLESTYFDDDGITLNYSQNDFIELKILVEIKDKIYVTINRINGQLKPWENVYVRIIGSNKECILKEDIN